MGQINDTTGIPKTESIVRLQKNVEAIQFPTVKRGTDEILEGALFTRDSNNVARKPQAIVADATIALILGGSVSESNILISWIHPNHTSGQRRIETPAVGGFDPSFPLEDALLAGVYGDGFVVGLPLTDRFFNFTDLATLRTADIAHLVLKGQSAGAAERVGDTVIGLPTAGATVLTAGERKLGSKAYIDGDIFYFSYTSDLHVVS